MALRESVGGLAASLVSILRTRFELFALEAAEQKSRLFVLVGLAAGAAVCLVLALLVFTVTVAVYFWPTEDRYVALGILAFVYFAIGIGLLVAIRSRLVNGPQPFAATLDELRRDIELINRIKQPSSAPVPPEWMPPGDRP
ncbi:phage holin family protein [Yanghanlia caeni]|uniref:Phage holin family protein n=1 Tax=Yanghanlia caeni TaxID=3064283 RepID=A0ABU1D2K6_9BURK|nr:phage holin family protein [Alcaligenaceae bacterium LG-2]HZH57123.1 phage holin family protein [Burkholderiaceae bacterium]